MAKKITPDHLVNLTDEAERKFKKLSPFDQIIALLDRGVIFIVSHIPEEIMAEIIKLVDQGKYEIKKGRLKKKK